MDDLHTAESWMKATSQDLEKLVDDVSENMRHIQSEVVKGNWKAIVEYQIVALQFFVEQKKEKETHITILQQEFKFQHQLPRVIVVGQDILVFKAYIVVHCLFVLLYLGFYLYVH